MAEYGMTEEELAEIFKVDLRIVQIADRYGYGPQSRQCMEECAELIQAICKHNRAILSDEVDLSAFRNHTHICEEMADVHIMLDQMQYLLAISDEEMNLEIDRKLTRQMKRMKEEGEEDL